MKSEKRANPIYYILFCLLLLITLIGIMAIPYNSPFSILAWIGITLLLICISQIHKKENPSKYYEKKMKKKYG